ncbi:MAG: rRNA adenine N(6)-methyltransferase family protein [Candidatus Bathyarchaeota archaeon]|nr:rRNA adenine N(6)-methyltransferase family protein [Candidatus Bathyarchaeota archaeon]
MQSGETVLEIGPGAGNITESLLHHARYLICIEKNQKYIPILETRFKEADNLKIIHDDALKTYLPKHDRLVSNLPYMISEAFFQRTLRLGFKSATFIVSKGFAETLLAEPGEKYTKLSWQAQLFYDITRHEDVPATAYLPEPRVSTTIISLEPRLDHSKTEKTLIELLQQGDKYTKNALRESLIRSEACETKKQAKTLVTDLGLSDDVLGSWASRLSLENLQTLEEKLSHVLTG